MAAPTTAQIQSAIITALPVEFKQDTIGTMRASYPAFFDPITGLTLSQLQAVSHMSTEINAFWQLWESSLLFGGVSVTGLGIGPWVGTGSGGAFLPNATIAALTIPIGFASNAFLLQHYSAISSGINYKFQDFVTQFTIGTSSYTGVSTATPVNPGVFTATLTPATLSALKLISIVFATPTQVSSTIVAGLSGFTTPYLTYYDAIAQALDTLFMTWMSTAIMGSNTATGVAVAGTGAGVGVSLTDGVIS